MRSSLWAKSFRCLQRQVLLLNGTESRWSYGVRPSSSFQSGRQRSTPLAKHLAEAIEVTGPISIASYMRQCLTSPDGGYYTAQNPGRDQFGRRGDFVTSPEISQIFGELVGIWFVAEWMKQDQPKSGVELIEVGPGRGSLMDDILRTLKNFKSMSSSIESIHLVEASPALRDTQRRLLCDNQPLEEVENGYKSISKYQNLPITWYEDIRFVPNKPDKTPFIVAHEFFDALPIHAFQSIPPGLSSESQLIDTPTGPLPLSHQTSSSKTNQWRELVVTPIPSSSAITISATDHKSKEGGINPEFQLSIAKASTPNSLVVPTLAQRYKDILKSPNSIIEISPESHAYAAEFARRIGGSSISSSNQPTTSTTRIQQSSHSQLPGPIKSKPSGAALVLDYGPKDTIPTSTLRGIRNHALVSPFSSPGRVDLSADVDFTALAEAALTASEGVEVHGPVEQGYWLQRMGVNARADMICDSLEGDGAEEGKKRIRGGVERLVERGGPGGMGRIYKALAIVPERGGKRPAGFDAKP